MKPKVIVFSATESLHIARDFSAALARSGTCDCEVWRDLRFSLNGFVNIDLVAFGKKYDFALFIFGYEDEAKIKHKRVAGSEIGKTQIEDCVATRDNVIYEYGLMSGLIGRERCFIIDCFSESYRYPTRLPSDVKGIQTVEYHIDVENRGNEIHLCLNEIIHSINKLKKKECINEDLVSRLSISGLSAFYFSREDFKFRKSDDGASLTQIKDYLNIAKKSIKIIAFTSAHSVIYGEAGKVLKAKIEEIPDFIVTVSLLNCFDPKYYLSNYVSLDRDSPDVLIREGEDGIEQLRKYRDELREENRTRFNIKLHNTAKFETAVLIDDEEDDGRIQIEIKPYKVNVFGAYSFEIRKTGSDLRFYDSIKDSYDKLLSDATDLDKVLSYA